MSELLVEMFRDYHFIGLAEFEAKHGVKVQATPALAAAVVELPNEISRSETWVPKRGGLKAAGKRQESANFLQRSFFDVAVQFFVCCSAAFGPNDFRTAEKQMLQCSFCSAALQATAHPKGAQTGETPRKMGGISQGAVELTTSHRGRIGWQ